jgi:hypothetical protein
LPANGVRVVALVAVEDIALRKAPEKLRACGAIGDLFEVGTVVLRFTMATVAGPALAVEVE